MKDYKIAIIGLGIVGLRLTLAFAKHTSLIAYDRDKRRIQELKQGYDRNLEITKGELFAQEIGFTDDETQLGQANFYIICVSTLVDLNNQPELSALYLVSEALAAYLKKNDIIVYESTVYPGFTEDICIPILEKCTQLQCITDFGVGFSPERINPGDSDYHFETITKIIAATDSKTLKIITEIYQKLAGVKNIFITSQIRSAEAIKLLENAQRDINIAFCNEMAQMLHENEIDTGEVFAGMKTKWNALNFYPGFVGGHCIGLSVNYLLYWLQTFNQNSNLLAATRHINQNMANYVKEILLQQLNKLQLDPKKVKLGILGISYKANCADARDSVMLEFIQMIQPLLHDIQVYDPVANLEPFQLNPPENNPAFFITSWSELQNRDVLLIGVAHQNFNNLKSNEVIKKLNKPGLVIDLTGQMNAQALRTAGLHYWRL